MYETAKRDRTDINWLWFLRELEVEAIIFPTPTPSLWVFGPCFSLKFFLKKLFGNEHLEIITISLYISLSPHAYSSLLFRFLKCHCCWMFLFSPPPPSQTFRPIALYQTVGRGKHLPLYVKRMHALPQHACIALLYLICLKVVPHLTFVTNLKSNRIRNYKKALSM